MLLKVEVLTFCIFFSLNHTPAVQKVKMAALFFFHRGIEEKRVRLQKSTGGQFSYGKTRDWQPCANRRESVTFRVDREHAEEENLSVFEFQFANLVFFFFLAVDAQTGKTP